jgi:hypothetical protein
MHVENAAQFCLSVQGKTDPTEQLPCRLRVTYSMVETRNGMRNSNTADKVSVSKTWNLAPDPAGMVATIMHSEVS